jgi:FkbM family methyltransferase
MKALVKSLLRPVGLELRRLPRELPHEKEGDLGLYDTPGGKFLVPLNAPGDTILQRIKTGQVFEPEVTEVAQRYIRPGTAVLDLGANFGQMSLLFSRMTGPEGEVYSFEAQKRVFEILKRNMKLNGASNVKPVFGAVFNESGRVFHFPPPDFERFDSYGSYNVPLDATRGDEVTSLKIDDLKIEKPISFMKVDVQGCDLFAIQGARETIGRHRMPILFEFEQRFQAEYGTTFQDYADFTAEISYKFAETVLDINFLIVPA